MVFENRFDGIEFAVNSAPSSGLFLEFGVHSGESIKLIAKLIEPKKIHGFDSFIGLPEDWHRGADVYKKGHFALKELPKVPYNVNLIEGFFEDSLPVWKEKYTEKIAFLHIDADLYSSAKTILTQLDSQIISGTIICFDEYCDWTNSGIYDSWEEGEYKAFKEWGRECELICKHGLFGAVFKVL